MVIRTSVLTVNPPELIGLGRHDNSTSGDGTTCAIILRTSSKATLVNKYRISDCWRYLGEEAIHLARPVQPAGSPHRAMPKLSQITIVNQQRKLGGPRNTHHRQIDSRERRMFHT